MSYSAAPARILALVTAGLLYLRSVPAAAQVGLASVTGSVTLVAHVDARGSISSVTPPREIGQIGSLTETVTTVRLFSNAGYRLMVRRVEGSPSRLWVQAASGEFVMLTAGGLVTVALNTRGSGDSLQDVHFRFETPVSGGTLPPLPVRYEIAIDPAL